MNTFIKNNSLLLGTYKEQPPALSEQLTLVFNTNLGDQVTNPRTIAVPITGAVAPANNVTIDWGDNTSLQNVTGRPGYIYHTYSTHGIYTVKLFGSLNRFSYQTALTAGMKDKLIKCLSFGNLGVTQLDYAFFGCVNLNEAPKSFLPFMPAVTRTNLAFGGCSSFNGDISGWDMGGVITTQQMFQNCTNFNQPLNAWNTGNITSMLGMFENCTNFNQPLNNWNTSKVTNLNNTFFNCTNFNQSLNNWNTGLVTNMSTTFYGATNFNGDVSTWNTSNVTTMYQLFYNCINFNKSLSNWNVSKVTNMISLFQNCDSFTSNLGSWNLSGLNLSNNLNNFMFDATGMSINDYNATLIGWNNNKALFRNDLRPNFGGSKYSSAAASARAALIAYGWTITDGGLAP